MRAHEEEEDFLVIIMIPLMPGFEGDITKPESSLLKLTIMYEQMTINKGSYSLFDSLLNENIDPDKYIKFRGVRTHDVLKDYEMEYPPFSGKFEKIDKPIQSIIYVHSKLMIVDDRKFIIGSANINDRSLLGTRDSEIAVLVEDLKIAESKMNGKPFVVSETAHNFRVDIFKGKILIT